MNEGKPLLFLSDCFADYLLEYGGAAFVCCGSPGRIETLKVKAENGVIFDGISISYNGGSDLSSGLPEVVVMR